MPIFISLLGGAGIAWWLIESGYAIQALVLLVIWIVLLWTWPIVAVWFVIAALTISTLALALAYWEFLAAVILALALGVLLLGGLHHTIKALS